MCNEAYEGRPFAEMCRSIRSAGYSGIEIAPFTLAERPADITAAQRRQYRDIMASEGLAFAGLHWLMVSPRGLHVTTPDAALRARSWQHIRALIDLCADLGPNGVMVFGSPKQRSTWEGQTREAATRNFVREVGSPAVQTMFDVHNAIDEKLPHAQLVDRYFDVIRHVHVNELDGRHCGAGDYDFKPVLEVLRRRNYAGWVSLEAFDFKPGADRLAVESLRHLESAIAKLPS